jgi:hypothetical protein
VLERKASLHPRSARPARLDQTVPTAIPLLTTLRSRKFCERSGAPGQNCDTNAPFSGIRRARSVFSFARRPRSSSPGTCSVTCCRSSGIANWPRFGRARSSLGQGTLGCRPSDGGGCLLVGVEHLPRGSRRRSPSQQPLARSHAPAEGPSSGPAAHARADGGTSPRGARPLPSASRLAAGTGVRQGEAFGLPVDRVDFLRRRIMIDRQLVLLPREAPVLAPPRADASRRIVPLPQALLDGLAEHLRKFQWDRRTSYSRRAKPGSGRNSRHIRPPLARQRRADEGCRRERPRRLARDRSGHLSTCVLVRAIVVASRPVRRIL